MSANDEHKRPQNGTPLSQDAPRPERNSDTQPSPLGSSWAALSKALKPIRWDWPGWLPRGFLVILASEPGVGKSMLCLRLAASYLDGLPWPDGAPFMNNSADGAGDSERAAGDPERATIVWCESEAGHALNLQRARRWGLDLSRVLTPLDNPLYNFTLDDPRHSHTLLRLARRDDVRLVVLDSLRGLRSARRDRASTNQLLSSLADIARIGGKPVLLTHHLRKGVTLDAHGRLTIDSLLGSAAIPQSARVIWALDTPDPADPQNRRLSVIKNNLALPPDPIGMRVGDQGVRFGPPPEPPSPNRELDRAIDFLQEQLAGGPMLSRLLKRKYRKAGLSERTINRAKKRLAIDSFRPSGQPYWFWALPDKKQKS